MKTKQPATLKSTLLDAVLDLRYTRRGVTFDMIQSEVVADDRELTDEETKLLKDVNSQITRSKSREESAQTCLNRLMDILG